MKGVAALLREAQALAAAYSPRRAPLTRYRDDPVGYARDVLGVRWWAVQEEIARAVLEPPHKVLVQAAHSVGKTFLAAGLVSWWYDTRDPGAVITTAPTERDVEDLLWREVRLQRGARGGFVGPSAPELRSAPDHYAKGFTAARGESFQGRHDAEMLFIFDEAVGIKSVFWETTKSMFKPGAGHAWLCIFNPTDTTSRAYQECRSGRWRVVRMAAADHPNVAAELAGRPPPFPSAVSLSQLEEGIAEGCEPVLAADRAPGDFEWRPGSMRWFRPGPVFQARWGGYWPTLGTYGVWSEMLWDLACALGDVDDIGPGDRPELGCDVARYGDDFTAIHGRVGGVSVLHERHNGWSVPQTAGRLKELCRELGAAWGQLPQRVPVKIDDDGVGGGVVDLAGGHRFVAVNAGGVPRRPDDYPNTRSELWFAAAAKARAGLLGVGRLPRETRERLGLQLLAPAWKHDAAGRRVVESKDDTKKKLGFSPDDADAMNLAYHDAPSGAMAAHEAPRRPAHERRRGFGPKR